MKPKAPAIPQQEDISEYLRFEPRDIDPTKRTVVVDVVSKRSGETLGLVQWFGPWHKYAFFPNAGTLYDGRCLADVMDLMGRMMRQRRHAVQATNSSKKQARTADAPGRVDAGIPRTATAGSEVNRSEGTASTKGAAEAAHQPRGRRPSGATPKRRKR